MALDAHQEQREGLVDWSSYCAGREQPLRQAAMKEMKMTANDPSSPFGDQPPMPAPPWAPEVPVEEPEPDLLPDEWPNPNPDETGAPPVTEPRVGM
jgi:hypothetical protein